MRADLTTLQNNFAQALLDIDALVPALGDFKGQPAVNRERIGLYRGNVHALWQQSCASAFPVLRQLLGGDFFDELTRSYGRAHPSPSGDLNEFAAALPAFVSSLDSCSSYPYLRDVAALEWLAHRSYYQEFQTPVTLADFAALPIEKLGDLRCTLQPCCALFESAWAVDAIWHAHQQIEPQLPDVLDNKSISLVWRESFQASWQVHVSPISAGTYQALHALRVGEPLGVALEQALVAEPEFALQTALADWLQKQLITSITLD